MHIARRFTTAGRDPYETVPFRTASSEIRNPDGSVVFAGRGNRGAGRVEPGRLRHPRAEILPQGRCAGASGAGRGAGRSGLAVAAHRRRRRRSQRWPRAPATAAKPAPSRSSTGWPAPGPIGAGRAAISTREEDASRLLRRDPADAGAPDGRAELAAMVQHRAPLGLRHRRPGAGPLLRRPQDRQGARLRQRLRAPAAARLLHPVGRRRPRQRGRHHGSLGARGAALQIRLRLRLQFLEDCAATASGCRAAGARRG